MNRNESDVLKDICINKPHVHILKICQKITTIFFSLFCLLISLGGYCISETLFCLICEEVLTQFCHGELTMVLFKFTMKLPFQFEEINQVTSKWLKYGVRKRENLEFSKNSQFFSNTASQNSSFNSKNSHFGKMFLQLITLISLLLWNIFPYVLFWINAQDIHWVYVFLKT